jgi:hypothetical protein
MDSVVSFPAKEAVKQSLPRPEEARQRRLEGRPQARCSWRPSSFDKLRTLAVQAPQDEGEIASRPRKRGIQYPAAPTATGFPAFAGNDSLQSLSRLSRHSRHARTRRQRVFASSASAKGNHFSCTGASRFSSFILRNVATMKAQRRATSSPFRASLQCELTRSNCLPALPGSACNCKVRRERRDAF